MTVEKTFRNFITQLPANSNVADVGCGTGKSLKIIQKIRPDITLTGIDIENTEEYLPSTVRFLHTTKDNPVYNCNYEEFDAVVCRHVLEHVEDIDNFLSSIQYIVKRKGSIFIETPNWTRLFIPFHNMFFWNDYTHIRPYTKKALMRIAKDFNFTICLLHSMSSISFFSWKGITKSERKSIIYIPVQLFKKLSELFYMML